MLVSAYCMRSYKKKYGQPFRDYLKRYNELYVASEDILRAYQQKQLKNLLLESYNYTRHYKEIMKAQSIEEQEIKEAPYSVLEKLPLLEKQTIKSDLDSLLNSSRSSDQKNFTSGTTGSPMITFYDEDSLSKSNALLHRFFHYIGIQPKDRSVRFSGRIVVDPIKTSPPFWVQNVPYNQLFMSSYHLTNEHMGAYVKKLNSFKPLLIEAYPSAIYALAKFINENEIKLAFRPVAISTSAETLYKQYRDEIEKAFDCKVYNQYASSEGSPFITECVEGRLHINTDSGVFEYGNKKSINNDTEYLAELVVTSFRSSKTPLIRFKTGDFVRIDKEVRYEPCKCGCCMPTVNEIIGREDDILYTRDRGYVGRMDTAYKGVKGILKSQIVQPSPDKIDVLNVVNEEYSKSEEAIFMGNLRDRLGEEVEINVILSEDIPLGKNGKFKAVKRAFDLSDIEN